MMKLYEFMALFAFAGISATISMYSIMKAAEEHRDKKKKHNKK